jgi:hypothetical protein
MATRRGFLAGLAAAALPRLSWADAGSPAFLAAAKLGEGYVLCGLDAAGGERFRLPLPARGHAAAAHPVRPEAVAFARRPGTYALVIDCARGEVVARLTPPEGRQFNGHGAFSADGAVLYTSEVVAEGSAGRLGLWETAGWRRIGEVQTGGIGPHDVKRRADGGLVVANGGIETDPGDRTKLNIETMAPNLAYLSAGGALQEVVALDAELRQASIRHLALAPDGTVAFAMQWEGDPAEAVPLLGLHRRGSAPVLSLDYETAFHRMKGLCRLDRAGRGFGADRADLAAGRGGAALRAGRGAPGDAYAGRCQRRGGGGGGLRPDRRQWRDQPDCRE